MKFVKGQIFYEYSQFDGSIWVQDGSTQIYRNGDKELIFEDPSAGAVTLSSLLGGGGGAQVYRDRIQFNSNLDTVSPPILMRGDLATLDMYPESKINDNATTFQARLDSTDTWTDVSSGILLSTSITNLLAWVNTNVSGTVQWEYRCNIIYDTGQDGETSILVDYTLI